MKTAYLMTGETTILTCRCRHFPFPEKSNVFCSSIPFFNSYLLLSSYKGINMMVSSLDGHASIFLRIQTQIVTDFAYHYIRKSAHSRVLTLSCTIPYEAEEL